MTLQERILNERIFVSPWEASEMLGCSKRYVYRLIEKRRLHGTAEKPIRITTASMKSHLNELLSSGNEMVHSEN